MLKNAILSPPSPSAADQHRIFENLAASLAEQGKWLAVNLQKLNEDKTDALLVSSKDNVAKKRIASIPLVVGDASIIPSPVVRNLGVLLDSRLTMEQQINASCRSSLIPPQANSENKEIPLFPIPLSIKLTKWRGGCKKMWGRGTIPSKTIYCTSDN